MTASLSRPDRDRLFCPNLLSPAELGRRRRRALGSAAGALSAGSLGSESALVFPPMRMVKPSHRLVIVTGKGGVGKTLLAAATARLSAAQGLRTVLVTLDVRDDQHPLLDVPLRYRPADTPYGFAVSRVDAFQAAAEYARRSLPFGAVYEGFFKSATFRDF